MNILLHAHPVILSQSKLVDRGTYEAEAAILTNQTLLLMFNNSQEPRVHHGSLVNLFVRGFPVEMFDSRGMGLSIIM